ncbi:MAG: aminotransferase class V-fold PLP-dependent enzyme [Clostridia bacterium]
MIDVKKDFGILKDDLIYLDSSSTSLKPNVVVDEICSFYSSCQMNAERGISNNTISIAKKIQETRKLVKDFICADNEDEITFTSGATESSNMIALSYGLKHLKNGDEILLCKGDHKSTVLPWLNVVEILKVFGINIVIKEILIDVEGDYKEQDLIGKVNDNTKVIVLTHIHNMYGLEMDIQKLIPQIREKNNNAIIVLDASQSVGHINVDVQKLNPEFLYFSGHKMFAGMGVGVLYTKRELLKEMQPFKIGGGFKNENLEIKKGSDFESGTQNIAEILSLKKAIEYINSIGMQNIEYHIYEITRYLFDKLNLIKNIEFNKGVAMCKCALGYGIISFKINGISSSELGEILRDYNVVVRTGNFCNTSEKDDFVRVSLHVYNTKEDIDKFVKILNHILES